MSLHTGALGELLEDGWEHQQANRVSQSLGKTTYQKPTIPEYVNSFDSFGNNLSRMLTDDYDADGEVDRTTSYEATYVNESYMSSMLSSGDTDMDGEPNYSSTQESTFTWMCP